MLQGNKAKAPHARCEECSLCENKPVHGFGPDPENAIAVLVGEAPGRNEVDKGQPFVGKAGSVLRSILSQLGIDPEDCYMTNTILCRPPANKIGQAQDATVMCRSRLVKEILPYVRAGVPIFTLGKTAAQTLLKSDQSMSKLRGEWYKDGRVYATWHPSGMFYVPQRLPDLIRDLNKIKHGGPYPLPDVSYLVLESTDELWLYVDGLTEGEDLSQTTICIDLECDWLNWWEDDILSIGIGLNEESAIIIPEELVYDPEVARALTVLFTHPQVRVVGHNFKFDAKFLRHQLGVPATVDQDTMLAHYVLDENSRHGLKYLLKELFDVPDYEDELVKKHLPNSKSRYGLIPREDLYHYNALDVCYNLLLWESLRDELVDVGMYKEPYRHPIIDSQAVLIDMELRGVLIDTQSLEELSVELRDRIAEVQAELERLGEIEGEFNPRSWQQVSRVMYEHFNMPKVRGRGYKAGSTCAAAREKIKDHLEFDSDAYQWLEILDTYKRLEKLRSSYVDNLPDYVASDGRVHPDFKIHGTEIGRLSASDPAVQTIPRPGTGEVDGVRWGKAVRDLFTVPEGWRWVKIDYSQAELRVAAALSGDKFLMDVYTQGRDLHSEVAVAMYGDDFTKEERQLCKNFNFSYLYGGTQYSFANEVGLDMATARRFVRRYNKVMSGLSEWKNKQFSMLRRRGYVDTPTGRRRRFPIVTRKNQDDARKASVHAVVSGSASDLNLISMIRIARMDLEGVRILLTVHDEIDFAIREDRLEEVIPVLIETMEEVGSDIFPQLPWKADAEVGPAWGSIKKWKP